MSRRRRLVHPLVAVAVAGLVSAGCFGPSRADSPSSGSGAPFPEHPAMAMDVLDGLRVQDRASGAGYRRAAFGESWTDDVAVDGGHNGCDTREDVLRRDLEDLALKPGTGGCVAVSGVLVDPYTGGTVLFHRGPDTSPDVQIDHVVALGDAWRTGAQQLSVERRAELANDPLNLLAVAGQVNQDKGDGDAATWLPPLTQARCLYAARQVAVKQRYGLWVTPAEGDALRRVLAGCPGRGVPTVAATTIPPPRG
ncbi:HNH endonuclease family protein [Nakamurella endophytica]|uniref:GmrSD restriction endonucleases C-terminal domain-containing protein n=1 Tax=Nakamurella endophytica TaxID=1748367 RepID=A0A917SP81_9ACTN|nr:HNH endonuclease family protein [Nakamurella endophytica]GGL89544.1 hypothetical protein GCM10011594_06460 [Nakamurella endophytica]